MKLDFLAFGGGGGSGPKRGAKLRIPRSLIRRYMRQRLEVRPLDDSRATMRVGLIAAGLFFGLLFAFALIAPISGAAIAPGQVISSGSPMFVQPATSGLVTDILVREGQTVRAGQPLVRLNGIQSGAQLQQAQARRDGLRAIEARLIAERDELPSLTFPPDLAARGQEPSARQAMQAQSLVFARNRSILAADRNLDDTRLTAARAKLDASTRQLALIDDELTGVAQLYEKGFARKTTVRALQRAVAQFEADVAVGGATLEEARIQRQRTRDAQLMQIAGQLGQVQEQLAQLEPQLGVSRYLADQAVLRAGVAGRVSGLAPVGPGTVVSGGRTLMEIVPDAGTLVIEARVRPEDVDDVQVGSVATVRFSTVNPHGQSAFTGRVATLSPARVADENGGGYYRVRVVLDDPEALRRANVALQPGLPASVNIETERRTLWDYMMSPLRDATSRAFREE